MTNIQKNKLIYLTTCLIFLLCFLLFFGLKARVEFEEIKKLLMSLRDGQNEKMNIEKTRKSFDSVKSDFEKINASFVEHRAEPYFLEEVEGLAKDLGIDLKISAVSILNNEDVSVLDLEYLNIKLESKGDFNDLYKFLIGIENMGYKIEILKTSFIYGEGEIRGKAKELKMFIELQVLKKSK